MNLTEFAQLIASDSTNTAKNTLSFLIGNGVVNDNWNKALSNLYKSFPMSVKESIEQKAEFYPVLFKYFYKYSLNEDNIDIFNEYLSFFTATDKNVIKELNPKWNFSDNFNITFKNTLEFSRAIPIRNDETFDFINKNHAELERFVSNVKLKEKLMINFSKQSVWQKMIELDYTQFSDFCLKYQFNKHEILNNEIKSSTKFSYTSVTENKNIDLFLEDISIIGKDSLKKITDFFPNRMITHNHDNVLTLLLSIIDCNEFDGAITYMYFFENELNDYMKLLKLNQPIFSNNSFQLLSEQHKLYSNHYYPNSINSSFEKLIQNKEWKSFFNNSLLFNDLDQTLNKVKENKNKKLKI